MFEAGDRFVLEIGDAFNDINGAVYYKIKNIPWYSLSEDILSRLDRLETMDENEKERIMKNAWSIAFSVSSRDGAEYLHELTYEGFRDLLDGSLIKVGDEVYHPLANPFVVTKIEVLPDGTKLYTGIETGTGNIVSGGNDYLRTGRSFPDIARIVNGDDKEDQNESET